MDSMIENYEPMDIDVSGHSVKAMDISEEFSDFQSDSPIKPSSDVPGTPVLSDSNLKVVPMNQEVKKYHIVIQKHNRKDDNTCLKLLFALMVIIVSIITYQVNTIKCSDKLNIEEFSDILSKNVFGQSHMMSMLIETLASNDKSKIIIFYGGTGVGKTLVSSLLLESMGPFSNVYHYTMPSFKNTFSTELMLGVTFCKSSLIIVDDLTANDLDIKKQINDIIFRSENLKKTLTVILIFNCLDSDRDFHKKCDELFHATLLKNFAEIEVSKKFIQFEPLTVKELRKCIQKELTNKNLSDEQFDHLQKHFNVTVDGCKGVHSKIKYLTKT